MSSIRTPDQRLRVFISSTIEELKEERRLLREAIETLRMTPVFFEAGARPHPPRDLYRAYLDQSDIFIGVYARSYGWVAPDMSISGLEDEYRLSGERPKLIYIKEIEGERDAKLTELINDIRNSGAMSYQKFSTPQQLAELLHNDLAILLSERFFSERVEVPATSIGAEARLPRLRDASIGREEDLDKLTKLVLRPDVGLVTVVGPGGTGKSRIALEVAHAVQPSFRDGVFFIPLASLKDHALVAPAIAKHIGVYDTGQRSSVEVLRRVLFDKHMLLVLDNFEQLLPAATLLSELLDHCPGVKLLVSSRAPLHLRGEHIYALGPLRGPEESQARALEEIIGYPSVQLFIQRAREVSPDLLLNEANIEAIAGICRKLDGLPLAIELAAARTRVLSPVALYDRMENALGVLDKGARDLPERQRTMRATINWSFGLLDENARIFFRRLAVLNDRWTIEDAEKVTGIDGGPDSITTLVEQLVDQGLVRGHTGHGGKEPQFNLLHVVREFALEQLDVHAERASCDRKHAEYFSAVAAQLDRQLQTDQRADRLLRVEQAFPDLRAAFHFWVECGERPLAWKLIGDLRGFWTHAGMISEALDWARASGLDATAVPDGIPADVAGRALSTYGLILSIGCNYDRAVIAIKKALPLLESSPFPEDRGRAATYLAIPLVSMGDPEALSVVERAVELTRTANDDFDLCIALSFLCEVHLIGGNMELAKTILEEAGVAASRVSAGGARGMYLQQKANHLLLTGDVRGAEQAFHDSVELYDQLRMLPLSGWSAWGLGYTTLLQARLDLAQERFKDCMSRARRTNDLAMVASATLGFAMIAHERGQFARCAQLFGAAQHLAESIHYSFWSADKLLLAQVTACLHGAHVPNEVRSLIEAGKGLNTDATIVLALSE